MKTDILFNYFKKTLISAFGAARPVLLVIVSTLMLNASSSGDLIRIYSDEDCNPEMYVENNADRQQEVAPGRWILVKYCTKQKVKHFDGQVTKTTDEGLAPKPQLQHGSEDKRSVTGQGTSEASPRRASPYYISIKLKTNVINRSREEKPKAVPYPNNLIPVKERHPTRWSTSTKRRQNVIELQRSLPIRRPSQEGCPKPTL
ncbi:hypothetical protein ILUMI_11388 [Ignelater luminosus]|uniref:Uncharacterized protein n=1 Tax=Ignelater luminosus TaxID=2038154 RepID=A0A8K0D277_IGNLU|nr:hypothetical protein ILUMI_11388 [Ignelater luminosus]